MLEAICLVKEEGLPFLRAAKLTGVPRQSIVDRTKREKPASQPKLGRPQELLKHVELALVKCLKMCADYNYPMRKCDLQDLVQTYCEAKEIKTRWTNDRPGKHWVRHFRMH